MIYPVTMYAGKCDNCGKEINFWNEYSCLSDESSVLECMGDSDWFVGDSNWFIGRKDDGKHGGKHYCSDCFSYDDNDNLVLKTKNENQQHELDNN